MHSLFGISSLHIPTKLWSKLHCSKHSGTEKYLLWAKKAPFQMRQSQTPRTCHQYQISATAPTFVLAANFTEDRAKTSEQDYLCFFSSSNYLFFSFQRLKYMFKFCPSADFQQDQQLLFEYSDIDHLFQFHCVTQILSMSH